ncbi:MAG: hypothetical protein WCD04_09995 [Terriglobia bacterium]|jgi:hypothetical protein
MAQGSQQSDSKWRDFVLLVFLVFVVYNANFRLIRWDDSIPARLLPFNLVLHGKFCLEPWINPYLSTVLRPTGIYFAAKIGAHWLSSYPVILPVVIAPLYVFPGWWFSKLHIDPAAGDLAAIEIADVMEKLSASLVAALSVGVLYLALRRVASRRSSLLLSAVYGVASSTWSISGQSLWRQGFTELGFALLLCALLRDSESPTYAFWIGGAVALLASNAPHYIPFALLFSVFFLLRQPGRLWLFCVPLVIAGGLELAYNLHYFGSLGGPHVLPQSGSRPTLAHSWDGLAGLLISPSRGLLIFMPWVVFALWGMARAWRENKFGWERYLILGMAIVFGLHACLGEWWAGWCFGPRYLTDFLPLLVFFILPIWSDIGARSVLRVAFGVAVVVALWVQIVGACYYPRGEWDGLPVSVQIDHRRLWEWRDTTISRSWHARRPEPSLYFELWSLSEANANVRFDRASPSAERLPAK